ncbi:MAG TPA: hypothetical protein VLI05_04095 [Candidatus Saccharimonadia bacterium]|nr:hypothetical protein [Candidatus Saccharimonadia bacterium]
MPPIDVTSPAEQEIALVPLYEYVNPVLALDLPSPHPPFTLDGSEHLYTPNFGDRSDWTASSLLAPTDRGRLDTLTNLWPSGTVRPAGVYNAVLLIEGWRKLPPRDATGSTDPDAPGRPCYAAWEPFGGRNPVSAGDDSARFWLSHGNGQGVIYTERTRYNRSTHQPAGLFVGLVMVRFKLNQYEDDRRGLGDTLWLKTKVLNRQTGLSGLEANRIPGHWRPLVARAAEAFRTGRSL